VTQQQQHEPARDLLLITEPMGHPVEELPGPPETDNDPGSVSN
jgi:hypothetical protein